MRLKACITSLFRMTMFVLFSVLTLTPSDSRGATFVVDSNTDTHDVNPGDGIAVDDYSNLTFRAAIEEANALPGSDTVIVADDVSPIKLHLGAVVVEDNRTVIRGQADWPVIDGINNPFGSATLILASDSNVVIGLTFRRSRGDAIAIRGAFNSVGGNEQFQRNIFRGNGLDNSQAAAVNIGGSQAIGNVISGNWIGIHGNGTAVDANRNGIIIEQNASENEIGGIYVGAPNLISGNNQYGVIIKSGAHHNRLTGNIIGPDITGELGPGNQAAGVMFSGSAYDNYIGGPHPRAGNLISGNHAQGIILSGSDVYNNVVRSNLIGTEITGRRTFGNKLSGIELRDGAHDNLIGGSSRSARNLISGNYGHGLYITGVGTSNNTIVANLIGIDLSGYRACGNGRDFGDGLLIDSGATGNYVGGSTLSETNTISGNFRFGLHIDGAGTENNRVTRNYIGVNAYGTSSVFNSAGVVISGSARYNIIGGSTTDKRNVISGNRAELFPYGAGVLIYNPGTSHNLVIGNYIGLDHSGTRALRNGSAGLILGDGTHDNIIGGENSGEGNVISGNGTGDVIEGIGRGIHIFGNQTARNRIAGNLIGLSASGTVPIANNGHGIGIFAGASKNIIGGENQDAGNIISGNEYHGIFVSGSTTAFNRIRYNRISKNDSLGIAIRDNAQSGVIPPILEQIALGSLMLIRGKAAPPGAIVDIYQADPDPSGAGEGAIWLGGGFADAEGLFTVGLFLEPRENWVTATVTDVAGNSSEFAENLNSEFTSAEDDTRLPLKYSLSLNYPNPFNPTTTIGFSLARSSAVKLVIFNQLGQIVATLVDAQLQAGEHSTQWNGTNQNGQTVGGGVYFYRLTTNDFRQSRKMLLLK